MKHERNHIKHPRNKINQAQTPKLNKHEPSPYPKPTDITKLNNDSQIQENKAQNMKYVVRERKPIPFS